MVPSEHEPHEALASSFVGQLIRRTLFLISHRLPQPWNVQPAGPATRKRVWVDSELVRSRA
jgi:hypothetical protein